MVGVISPKALKGELHRLFGGFIISAKLKVRKRLRDWRQAALVVRYLANLLARHIACRTAVVVMNHLEKQSKELQHDLTVSLARLDRDAPLKAVHRLRTTARRIQTLLQSHEVKLRGKHRKAVRELERIRKRAGKVRDLDVELELLKAIGNRSAEGDRRALKQALTKKRSTKSERLSEAARDLTHSTFADHLHETLQRVTAAASDPAQGDAPLAQARVRLQALANDFAAEPRPKAQRLHEIRIELKRIRYLAELDQASDAQQQFLANVKAVGEVLGQWRDWSLLAKSAAKNFKHRDNVALVAEIRALQAAKFELLVPAVARLLSPVQTAFEATPRKQPQSSPARVLAQRA